MDKETLLRSINLSSYSFSLGWIGYFEGTPQTKLGRCDKAVDLLCKMIARDEFGWPQIWSSLSYPCDIKYIASLARVDYNELSGKVMQLVGRRVLRLVDFSKADTNYTEDEYENFLDEVKRDFRVEINPDPFFLRDSCVSKMDLSGVLGHCFLYYESLELFAYPHDEVGFGFIFSINARKEQKALFKELLEKIDDDFLLFLEKERTSQP